MADDEIAEWKKLSTFDKVQHANWKCRKMGYEDLLKELQRSLEGDAIFKKYSILVKKFVTEQNELSRMLATEVAVLVVEGMTSKDAAKVASGVVDGIILKVLILINNDYLINYLWDRTLSFGLLHVIWAQIPKSS